MSDDRFEIMDFDDAAFKGLKNYYVFKVPSQSSPTGFNAMCINKEYAERMKQIAKNFHK